MSRLYHFIRGYIRIKICGASPQWVLNHLAANRIPFWDVVWEDAFKLPCSVHVSDQKGIRKAAEKGMCDIREGPEIGLKQTVCGVRRRKMLLFGLVFSVAVVLLLQRYVLFYQIIGNERVPTAAILRQLQELGIGFGTPGRQIIPQWVKDNLLQDLPELEWITVVHNGSRAQVIVRERPEKTKTEDRSLIANVVASRGGMITKQSVMAGQQMRQVGDTVSKGDILISGFVDLGRTVLAQHANGEIYARTWYEEQVVRPISCYKKIDAGEKTRSIWLVVGEKRIKIYGNSGIVGGVCDKMNYSMTIDLPGDLVFPITLLVQDVQVNQWAREEMPAAAVEQQLKQYQTRCVQSQMVAGEILDMTANVTKKNACYLLTSMLECHEMIARSIEVEWYRGGNVS